MRSLVVLAWIASTCVLTCSCSKSGAPEPAVASAPRIDGTTESSFYASVPVVAKSVEGTPQAELFERATSNAFRRALDNRDPDLDVSKEADLEQASDTLRRTVRESLHGLTALEAIERFASDSEPPDAPR